MLILGDMLILLKIGLLVWNSNFTEGLIFSFANPCNIFTSRWLTQPQRHLMMWPAQKRGLWPMRGCEIINTPASEETHLLDLLPFPLHQPNLLHCSLPSSWPSPWPLIPLGDGLPDLTLGLHVGLQFSTIMPSVHILIFQFSKAKTFLLLPCSS